jgi:hypothetical protein
VVQINENLIKELKRENERCEERFNIIMNEFKQHKNPEIIIEDMQKRTNDIAFLFLQKTGFRFGKDRLNNRARLDIENDKLMYKEFHSHTWCEVDFFNRYEKFEGILERLPIGFKNILIEIKKLMDFMEKKNDENYMEKRNPKLYIEFIKKGKVIGDLIENITVNDKEFKIETKEESWYHYDDDEHKLLLGNDRIFRTVLYLVKDRNKFYAKADAEIQEKMKEIDELLNNGYNKILIQARLSQHG